MLIENGFNVVGITNPQADKSFKSQVKIAIYNP